MRTRAVFVLLPVVPVIRLFHTNGLKQYVLERFLVLLPVVPIIRLLNYQELNNLILRY